MGVGTGLDSGRNECGVKTDPPVHTGKRKGGTEPGEIPEERRLFFSELDRLETDTEFHEDT